MLGLGNSLAISQPPSAADTTSFISTWETTGSDETIEIPIVNDSRTINFTIDWGDGSSVDTITAHDDDTSHEYGTAGTYTITMAGIISGFYFANGGSKTKIKTITQWGTLNLSLNQAFWGCNALTVTATDAPTITTTSFFRMFMSCSALTGDFSTWDVSSVTSMSTCFYTCANFNSPLADWDVSNVTTMNSMFLHSTVFNQDISSWDVSNVTDMGYMFQRAMAFNQDIDDWDTSSATAMYLMFQGITGFNQPLNSWDTSKVTTMLGMFNGCSSFNQNISSWDVTSVTNFTQFLINATLSTANYNLLLHHWEADDPVDSLNFHGGNATYDSSAGSVNGTVARAALISTHSWTITDGGAA